MLIGQPAEEVVDGAKAMLADHLYERFGTPDLAIALHDTNRRAAGTVSVTSGGLEGHKIPTVLFWLGTMNPAKFAAARAKGKRLPGLHTSLFQPDPEPTLRTGVTAMTSVAMDLLRK